MGKPAAQRTDGIKPLDPLHLLLQGALTLLRRLQFGIVCPRSYKTEHATILITRGDTPVDQWPYPTTIFGPYTQCHAHLRNFDF